MTAATAYDLCVAAGATSAMAEWEAHPALSATLTWSKARPGMCSIRSTMSGRYIGRAATVIDAILLGHEHGFRVFDTKPLGCFAPVSP